MRRALLVAALLIVPPSAGANGRLALRVTPNVAFAPATVRVLATVAADQENRAIEVVAESDTFYRSSQVPLDGDEAPRANLFQFRGLPPGRYQVTATLIDADGRHIVASQPLRVVAPQS